MYFSDHNPPHFHALYAEHEALFRINDGEVLRGELPRTAARLVREWIGLHRTELVENWERAQEPAALVPIDPLDHASDGAHNFYRSVGFEEEAEGFRLYIDTDSQEPIR